MWPVRARARLLIVDDSDTNRELTSAILEDAGFEVLTATNGLEGVIAAHYARPSVILMDLTMPVLNGLGGRAFDSRERGDAGSKSDCLHGQAGSLRWRRHEIVRRRDSQTRQPRRDRRTRAPSCRLRAANLNRFSRAPRPYYVRPDYIRALTRQSEAFIRAWYSAGDTDRLDPAGDDEHVLVMVPVAPDHLALECLAGTHCHRQHITGFRNGVHLECAW